MTVTGVLSEELKPESLALSPMGPSHAQPLCIFGTGDLGRSLGQRLLQTGYSVVFGSRRPDSCGPVPQGAQVMTHADAATSANLIFICVHRDHYDFLTNLAPYLQGKVLVDLSNNLKKGLYPEANAEYLQRLVPGAAVVKGLNTLSAWALQNGLLAGKQVRREWKCPSKIVVREVE
uniref:Pyrroline-5-carboxylate reductase catalytic N-terminal domain-containing protein n=1 Tax=Knipowitschia caucasica TaxID=637954 RepID=A0AAV2MDI3_KNICA